MTLAEVHREMVRMTAVLVEANRKYQSREQMLMRRYTGDPDAETKMADDHKLRGLGGTATTAAFLVTALSGALSAEVAYQRHLREMRYVEESVRRVASS
jgi:hypothetical protein